MFGARAAGMKGPPVDVQENMTFKNNLLFLKIAFSSIAV